MRLHLDTSSTAGTSEATGGKAAEKTATGLNTSGGGATAASGSNARDSVAVSGASSAWSTSFSDRAARVGELTAAVQSGTYSVSSALVSQSIVASAALSQSVGASATA